jgi:hypothetical protein
LVTVGDSLTHGFQSGAIFNTGLSWPAIVAYEAGFGGFRHPDYAGYDGIPVNFEYIVRELDAKFGGRIKGLNILVAMWTVRGLMGTIAKYWQSGQGSKVPVTPAINHNLATFGYDLRDALSLAPDNIEKRIVFSNHSWLLPVTSHAKERAALRSLPYHDAHNASSFPSMTSLQAAKALGEEGDPGIETLCVILGANNVLGTVFSLDLQWSQDDGYSRLGTGDKGEDGKDCFNIWQPQHFAAELEQVAEAVRGIKARHVIWGTVPHVTIAPLICGIGDRHRHASGRRSRYYDYYTRPWLKTRFDPGVDKYLTAAQARTIDSAIDQYNESIVATVRAGRQSGLDWRIVDLCGVLDRLASRRYITVHDARPSWWEAFGGEYPLPNVIANLVPHVDSQFFTSDPTGRTQGGLFALDGVHPTTIGYGIMAREVLRVMDDAGVTMRKPNGTSRAPGTDVDFQRLLQKDSLNASPPRSLADVLGIIGWGDATIEIIGNALKSQSLGVKPTGRKPFRIRRPILAVRGLRPTR